MKIVLLLSLLSCLVALTLAQTSTGTAPTSEVAKDRRFPKGLRPLIKLDVLSRDRSTSGGLINASVLSKSKNSRRTRSLTESANKKSLLKVDLLSRKRFVNRRGLNANVALLNTVDDANNIADVAVEIPVVGADAEIPALVDVDGSLINVEAGLPVDDTETDVDDGKPALVDVEVGSPVDDTESEVPADVDGSDTDVESELPADNTNVEPIDETTDAVIVDDSGATTKNPRHRGPYRGRGGRGGRRGWGAHGGRRGRGGRGSRGGRGGRGGRGYRGGPKGRFGGRHGRRGPISV